MNNLQILSWPRQDQAATSISGFRSSAWSYLQLGKNLFVYTLRHKCGFIAAFLKWEASNLCFDHHLKNLKKNKINQPSDIISEQHPDLNNCCESLTWRESSTLHLHSFQLAFSTGCSCEPGGGGRLQVTGLWRSGPLNFTACLRR